MWKGKYGKWLLGRICLHKVNSEKAVIHIKQAGKEVHIRFVGEAYPDMDCTPVTPTLEDYYMFIMKKGENENE